MDGGRLAKSKARVGANRDRLRLWIRLFETVHAIERQVRARLRGEFSCTLPQFDVMAALDRSREPMTMGELSRWLKVSNGNVTGVVERLVKDGVANRRSPPNDRRTSLIALTPRGRRHFAKMAAANKKWIDEMLVGLKDNEVRALIRGLDLIDGPDGVGRLLTGGSDDEHAGAET